MPSPGRPHTVSAPAKLRIFLDVNVIEVFLNDRLAIAQSVQPILPDSRNVSFQAVGGDAPVQKLNIWEMQPV
ncbi:MAG: GH32 C-terminal domain-containing protein [Clostridiales bacterium]|nr:GH32 C-terminal domain-containing protein [Clostridiales bacterium]